MFGSCTSGGVIYSHNFDLAMYTNNYSYPAEPDSIAYTAYHSSQIPTDANGCVGQNTTFSSDPQLDQALDQARLSVKLSDRKDKYIVAQRRLADLVPEIPTLVEQGYPGAVAENWTALFAPAKTPPEIIAKLNAAFTATVNDPDMRRKFAENAISPSPTSPDELGQLLRSEIAKWDKVIREKGITIKPED